MSKLCMIYVTVPSEEEGVQLVKGLLSQKLIACGTVSPPVTSLYVWQDNIQNDQERVIWLKTPVYLQDSVKAYLAQHHSYTLPFVAIFTPSVSDALAKWAQTACIQPEG